MVDQGMDATYINLASTRPPQSKGAKKGKQEERKRQKRYRKKMSHKQLKGAGMYDICNDVKLYSDFIGMNKMWEAYIMDVLSGAHQNNVGQLFLKSDLHGAHISVVKAKNPSLVHLSGIVLMETKFTFKVVTKENRMKVIPKRGSVICVDSASLAYKITIYGDQFCQRSAERTNHNFKKKAAGTIDL